MTPSLQTMEVPDEGTEPGGQLLCESGDRRGDALVPRASSDLAE